MILTDDTLLQRILGTHQSVALLRLHLTERNTGLLGHDGTQVVTLQFRTLLGAQFCQLVEDAAQEVCTLLDGGDLRKVGV